MLCICFSKKVPQTFNSVLSNLSAVDLKFSRTSIDSFDDAIELEQGGDRLVKCTFSLTTHGYLLPEHFNYQPLTNYEPTVGKIVLSEGDGLGEIEKINGIKISELK